MDDNLNEQAQADQAAMEAAFAAGFDDELESALPSLQEPAQAEATPEPEKAQEPQEHAQDPAKAEAQESEPSTPADPYEGLPEPVKRALAAIPALENELRRTTGQVRALQSAHDRAAAAAQAAAEVAPRSAAHEQVAETLPEVLATIEEVVAQRLKQHAPAPEPQQDTRLPDEIRLDEGFPQWRQIASSNDFKMWAAVQEDARTIQSTQDMVTFMGAITRFEAHRASQVAATKEAERQAALRNSRIDASLTPTRGAPRRPASTPQTEEEGFNSVWD